MDDEALQAGEDDAQELGDFEVDGAAPDQGQFFGAGIAVQVAGRHGGAGRGAAGADDGTLEDGIGAPCFHRVENHAGRGAVEVLGVIAGEGSDPLEAGHFEGSTEVRRQRDNAVAGLLRKAQERGVGKRGLAQLVRLVSGANLVHDELFLAVESATDILGAEDAELV